MSVTADPIALTPNSPYAWADLFVFASHVALLLGVTGDSKAVSALAHMATA